MKFSKVLYVKIERDGESSYPVADDDMASLAEMGMTVLVGVYKLASVKKLVNVSTLVDK